MHRIRPMKTYDHIVVGSGASGLTATLLLALSGRKVLLVEKAPRPGGSLVRFRIQGVPFDTGFHFTGGLTPNGLLRRMLNVLGLADAVEPVFMAAERSHQFVFEREGRVVEQPCGIGEFRRKLKDEFSGDQAAVDRYFDMVARVYLATASTDISRLGEYSGPLEEECVSLKEVLDGLTDNTLLKGVFSAMGMCYGVKPSEVSFASHSRVCYDMYESTARFRDGGDALIKAFEDQFKTLDVEVRCSSWVAEFREASDGRIGRAVLNTGDEIAFESAVLTIHPRQILELLPRRCISKAFVERVKSFEPSVGFFTVYGTLEGEDKSDFGSSIVSLFPTTDFDALLDPGYCHEQALVIVGNREIVGGVPCRVATILEPSFPQAVAQWVNTSTGDRPVGYTAYKQERVAAILKHLERYDRHYGGSFRMLGAASMLTYRDYLHSFDGSAYGVKQKLGQYNLIGRLPIRSLYVAGQSALLPGLAGAMMSAFIVIRSMLGKDKLARFVSERLCN